MSSRYAQIKVLFLYYLFPAERNVEFLSYTHVRKKMDARWLRINLFKQTVRLIGKTNQTV